MGIDSQISQRVGQFRSNPQALQQRYAQNRELLDLLALQKLKSEKEAAAKEMQMQMQTQPQTIKEQREAELMQMNQQELAQQVGRTNQQQLVEQKKAMSGIAKRAAGQPVQGMASGGIVGLAEGGPVDNPVSVSPRIVELARLALEQGGSLEDVLKIVQTPQQREALKRQLNVQTPARGDIPYGEEFDAPRTGARSGNRVAEGVQPGPEIDMKSGVASLFSGPTAPRESEQSPAPRDPTEPLPWSAAFGTEEQRTSSPGQVLAERMGTETGRREAIARRQRGGGPEFDGVTRADTPSAPEPESGGIAGYLKEQLDPTRKSLLVEGIKERFGGSDAQSPMVTRDQGNDARLPDMGYSQQASDMISAAGANARTPGQPSGTPRLSPDLTPAPSSGIEEVADARAAENGNWLDRSLRERATADPNAARDEAAAWTRDQYADARERMADLEKTIESREGIMSERYNPERLKRQQLAAWLMGAGGRSTFGSMMQGAGAAGMNENIRQSRAKLADNDALSELRKQMADYGMTMANAGVNAGSRAGERAVIDSGSALGAAADLAGQRERAEAQQNATDTAKTLSALDKFMTEAADQSSAAAQLIRTDPAYMEALQKVEEVSGEPGILKRMFGDIEQERVDAIRQLRQTREELMRQNAPDLPRFDAIIERLFNKLGMDGAALTGRNTAYEQRALEDVAPATVTQID